MSAFGSLVRKMALLLRRAQFSEELDEEMTFHREQTEQELYRGGMSAEEAHYVAMRRFGNTLRIREQSQEVVRFRAETVVQDARFALRQMKRSPGFAITATLMLGLGMGASVAIFAFVDTALIQPLPYPGPNQLMDVSESLELFPRDGLSYPDYLDWKRMNTVFSSMAAYGLASDLLRKPNGTQTVSGMAVSAEFLRTLGVRPAMGRDFRLGEDAPSAPTTLLLTERGWQRWFGKSKDVIGQVVWLSGEPVTVIGVLPSSFVFAPGGNPEYLKALQARQGCLTWRACHSLYGVGRLKNGTTMGAALAQMKAIAVQLEKEYPDSNRGQGASVMPLVGAITGDIQPILLVLLGGAGLLLLIACVNVGNLLLVRAEKRRREIAVRSALGASRRRLIRQCVTEGALLCLAGWAVALPLAYAAMHILLGMIAKDQLDSMPYLQGLGFTRNVYVFAGTVAVMAGALFSVAPILRLPSGHLREDLNEGGRGAVGRVWKRLGTHLVIAEISIAVLLLAGSGLLAKSLWRMLHVELGFVPDHLALLSVELPDVEFAKQEQQAAAAQAILERVQMLPGVQTAAVTTVPPVTCNCGTHWIRLMGKPYNGVHNEVNERRVSAKFFETIQARLMLGRLFTEADDAQHPTVVVINEALAQKYFPDEDPIGRMIGDTHLSKESLRKIVGVVANIRDGALNSDEWPTEYKSFSQDPAPYFSVMVRTVRDEKALLPDMAAAIRRLYPTAGLEQEMTMEQRIRDSDVAWMHRAVAYLVGGFAALAVVLTAIGLYGVIAYSVSQRTREIGVRMALGAQRGAIHGMILREAGWLTLIGIALGIGGAMGTGSLMGKLLFQVRAWDASTLAIVAVLFAGTAMLASFWPARRASQVNPVDALRAE